MKRKSTRLCVIAFYIYLLVGILFYFAAGTSLFYTSETTKGVFGYETVGELTAESGALYQPFVCHFEAFQSLVVTPKTFGRENIGTVTAEILSPSGSVLRTALIDVSKLTDQKAYDIVFEPISDARDQLFVLRLTAPTATTGNAVGFLHGNRIESGRGSVDANVSEEMALYHNGSIVTSGSAPCALSMDIRGLEYHWFGNYYWFFFVVIGILFALYLAWLLRCYRREMRTKATDLVLSLHRYSFLIRQLVLRDFKTKYKRSVLGILWSFLNPLLTMSIQYVVFSTLFRSDIENFIAYLLTGIICYNFFSEVTSMCLSSIVGNAPLIQKVYVPKYIYPLSRALSSAVNLLLSLLPLFLVLLLTGNYPTKAFLLLPFGLLMLFALGYGVGLLLSTMMVFFRDTQFLWNVATMLLMYLTPIFYPESIIPTQLLFFYKLNPLYHVLRLVRSILIDGTSLEPRAYLYCAILCLLPLLIGMTIFRKKQDQFVLNL